MTWLEPEVRFELTCLTIRVTNPTESTTVPFRQFMYSRKDLNLRPLGYKPSTLTDWVTGVYIFQNDLEILLWRLFSLEEGLFIYLLNYTACPLGGSSQQRFSTILFLIIKFFMYVVPICQRSNSLMTSILLNWICQRSKIYKTNN